MPLALASRSAKQSHHLVTLVEGDDTAHIAPEGHGTEYVQTLA